MSQPRFVPWSRVRSWICDACGECCRWFNVPVTMHEYAKLTRKYGVGILTLGVGRSYLKRRPDGRCIFQFRRGDRWLCGLQSQKPYACKIWPFILFRDAAHGRDDAARWESRHGRAYVYVDPRCPRIRYGKPTAYLIVKVLPELVEIAFGEQASQLYTTRSPPPAHATVTITLQREADRSTPTLPVLRSILQATT